MCTRILAALYTHRPLSSSFLWLLFRLLYKVIPRRNYLGAFGYYDASGRSPDPTSAISAARIEAATFLKAVSAPKRNGCAQACRTVAQESAN